jgi:hypothetical protein
MFANGVLRDVVYAHEQGVVYFRHIVLFHRTHVNVLAFTPIDLPCPNFHGSHKC